MAAIVNILTGEIAEHGVMLPHYFRLPEPDDGLALFAEIGDERPEHAPLFKAVQEVVLSEAPSTPSIATSTERVFDNDRVEVTHTFEPDTGAYQRQVERQIEAVAAERGYSSAVSAASYVSSIIPQWASEAAAFVAYRDAVWAYALGELAKVQAGQRQPPTLEDLLAELPTMTWPE